MIVFSRATEKVDPGSRVLFFSEDDGKFPQKQLKMTENGRKFCKKDGNWQKFPRFPRHIDLSVASHLTFAAALVFRPDDHDDALLALANG